MKFERSKFERKGRNFSHPFITSITLIGVVAASYGFGYLSYRFLLVAAHLLATQKTLILYGFVVVTGVPIWYIAGGLLYQITRFATGTIRLLEKSEPRDLSHILDLDAETYVLNHDGIFAGAASTGINDYIILSEGILNQSSEEEVLSEKEVAAILAHEEAHLKYRDAKIGLLIALFSPLLLTGKNILYAILNFREREFRADKYAARKVGKDHIDNALDTLQILKAQKSTDEIPNVTPTLLPLDSNDEEEPSYIERLFGFYFGDFAMTKSHPDLYERRDKLNSQTSGNS